MQQPDIKTLPQIGVVIIGINVEKYLPDCIRSVISSDYPRQLLEIVYVDGGSRDNSVGAAKTFDGIKVIGLTDPHPTPGRGRNAGWKALSTSLIQFMDADTILDPLWFQKALTRLTNNTVAVCGHRREKSPDKNLFHVLTNMEWRYEVGPCRYFGGDVLIRRDVLQKTNGFDEDLVAGEDPELSYRIRQKGWRIERLDAPMTTHDINMTSFAQYLKRAFRSGYAYAEVGLRFIKNNEKLWLVELFRICTKALIPICLIITGIAAGRVWLGVLLGLLILLRPLLRIRRINKTYQGPWKYAFLYALHSVFVVNPQFFGVLRYLWGRIAGRPLRNKGLTEKNINIGKEIAI